MRFPRKNIRPGVIGLSAAAADGNTPTTGRQCKTGESAVQQTHGKYYEAASRGYVYAACDQGAGVVVQVTITTTATLTLHNPVNSGKRLSILKLIVTYFSGTLGAGSFYHGFLGIGKTLPSSGTSLTSNCTDIGIPLGVTAVGVAIAGATVVAGTPLYPFIGTGPVLATTAVMHPPLIEDIDGAIVLEPGAQYQLLGVFGGTGSTPKVSPGIVWEEIGII